METLINAPERKPAETSMTPYETLRNRHLQDMRARMPAALARLDWSAQQLTAERETRLRNLARIAKERSAWHRQRLAGVDPDRLDEATLARHVPPMNKDDLMEHFDEIVTEPALTLDLCEAHLAGLKTDAYLLDRYHVNTSGGSSGRRGIAAYDWNAWADVYLGMLRYVIRLALRESWRRPLVGAVIAAHSPAHMSAACPQTFSDPSSAVFHRFPVSLPFDQIVDGVGGLQPDLLLGYPSVLHALALAARGGALKIAPRAVISASEPLLPEIRAAIDAAWDARLFNWWATTEGGQVASSCGFGPGMHLSDDSLIVEPVDANGRPVQTGARAAKVYVTNLFNPTLPLIRYELTDEVTFLDGPCPCGSAHRLVDDVLGRLDDNFAYPGVGTVYAHLFRSRLGQERGIVEYQVRQTPRGAEIRVRCIDAVDTARLARTIADDLKQIGLAAPEVTIAQVAAIERQGMGKLKRFIPLPISSH